MSKMDGVAPKEKIELAINIFTHVAEMLKNGKKDMVVTQDGEIIDLNNKKKAKKKM